MTLNGEKLNNVHNDVEAIIVVHPKMAEILSNVALVVSEGLRSLQITTKIINFIPTKRDHRVIVFGANFFPLSDFDHLREDSVIFNVENTSSSFMTGAYKRILRKYLVWDYDKQNAEELSRLIARRVYYLPLFYTRALSRIPSAQEDIDVLFYGSFNDRRAQILHALRARGLVVEAVFGVFGAELDKLISRAKVVINIHFYDNGRMEMIRLFDLLANRRAVVAELNPGEIIDEDLRSAVVTAPYDQLVDVTVSLVHNQQKRLAAAAEGFEAFRSRDSTEILNDALRWSVIPRLPTKAIIGSGKSYDENYLNIDIEDRWNPDLAADIADADLFVSEFRSQRFGLVRLQRGWFDELIASHVLEHIPDLVRAMRNCLDLLYDGGRVLVVVPYDLSYGAWQDPTHLHAFNERSWLYYCEWCWYLGWTDARFDLVEQQFGYSDLGNALAQKGCSHEEILRTPRAVDEMRVILQKRTLTDVERAHGRAMRGDARQSG